MRHICEYVPCVHVLSRVNNIVTGSLRHPKTLQNNCPAIVRRELITGKKSRVLIVRRLLKSTYWSIYYSNSICQIVQILSRYCPDIVWILSGRSNITKLQRGQKGTYIQRLTILRPPMGLVFHAIVVSWSWGLVCYQNHVF